MMDAEQTATSLVDALDPCTPDTLSPDDFVRERVDILIDAKDEAEVARTVRPPDPPDSEAATSPDRELPQDLLLRETHLSDNFTVRIGQVQAWTPTEHVAVNFPSMDPSSVSSIMEQVAYAFQSPSHVGRDHAPTVVLLPEVSIPQPEVKTVRDLVASSGRASLAEQGSIGANSHPPIQRPAERHQAESGSSTKPSSSFLSATMIAVPRACAGIAFGNLYPRTSKQA